MTEGDQSTSGTDRVEDILQRHYGDRVYTVEGGIVWVSGINANCRTVAESMAKELSSQDIPVGLVRDDDAVRFSGVEFQFGRYSDTDTEHGGSQQ